MRLMSLVVLFFVFISLSAQAKTAAGFYKRFQVVRDQSGKLIGIRDRTLPVKFEVTPYVEMIKKQIKAEQALMNNSNAVDYEATIRDLLVDDEQFFTDSSQYEAYVNRIIQSLKELSVLNVDGVFQNEVFKDVVQKYSNKMTDAILLLDPTMVAVTNNPAYFYTKNVTYKAVTWGLDFAKKRLSTIPLLNTASYVIVEVEKRITERRTFHQNLLLHYLENFSEGELGLTHDEVNLIWSSIYESRIPWFAFWESNNARTNWSKYGVNNFYLNYRNATNKLRNNTKIYSEVYDRIDYAFQEVGLNGDKVIINLFDNEGMFHNRPAVAYNYSRPTQIARKRIMFTLAELGLSFVPVGEGIKGNVTNVIRSYYQNQRLTEGALFGYFESIQNDNGLAQIKAQYLNPFDISL